MDKTQTQIVVRRGETPFAEHVTVTLGGWLIPPGWHQADEINRRVYYKDGARRTVGDYVFAGTTLYGQVVIKLNDDAPAEARAAYEAARVPAHLRKP